MSTTPMHMSGQVPRPKQRLFVDVPPSPFPLSRYSSISRKENAPLTPIASLLYRKRKLSDSEAPPINSTKKHKRIAVTPLKQSSLPTLLSAPNASVDFPNGFIYCHQCSRKRDISASAHCTVREIITSKDQRTTKEQRCKVKFCRSCLKNRYGEDLDVILSQKSMGKDKEHVNTENYLFKCPKCRDICNCSRCRKLKGLEPTGSLASVVRKAGAGSAAQYLAGGPDLIMNKSSGKGSINNSTVSGPSTKGSLQTKTLPRTLPVLQLIEIPVNFDLKEAETRFGIREFMMRFASIMEPSIAKVHLLELEDISGKYPDEEDEITGWVSEACVRAIILGILGVLAKQDDECIAKPAATAIKDIRATGTNLNKIWATLSRLRHAANEHSERGLRLSIPNPLPPPTSAAMHNTRNMRSNRDSNGAASIHIAQSAQIIPVVEALIQTAIRSNVIREELDSGVRDGKELTKTVKEYCRKKNEKGELERKAAKASVKDNEEPKGYSRQVKIQLEAEQRHLQHLEHALKLVVPGFALRFMPLGTDSEERVYWALSPGVAERKAALDFITALTSAPGETGRRDKRLRGATRRQASGGSELGPLKQWSWFVAIWGKKPVNGEILWKKSKHDTNDEDYNSEEDEDVDKWWAVDEPKEIRKVAEWVTMKSGVDQKEGSLDARYSSLVKGLNDYAAQLEWRLLEDKFEAPGEHTND